MTPTTDNLTRVARAICRDMRLEAGVFCQRMEARWSGDFTNRPCQACQKVAKAAIEAMEKNDE